MVCAPEFFYEVLSHYQNANDEGFVFFPFYSWPLFFPFHIAWETASIILTVAVIVNIFLFLFPILKGLYIEFFHKCSFSWGFSV